MAKADNPGAEEFREIARRLCALIDFIPDEPVNADQLRQVVDDHQRDKSVRLALNICADALAAHELPEKIRELLDALRDYIEWFARGAARRERLARALSSAGPLLNEEADARAQGRAEATAQALTEEQRADGYIVELWPSPESLRFFPHEVLELLEREAYALPWLLKLLEDLPRLDASHRVISVLAPVKTGIAKILHAGGYDVPAIADVVEPYATRGRKRAQAQNTVRARIKSTSEDWLFTRRVDPSVPTAAAIAADLEDAARFVAGVGRNVLILAPLRPTTLSRGNRAEQK
jgi:hypothetical protein